METINKEVDGVRRRIGTLTGTMRWIWVANAGVAITAALHRHYEVAVLAGLGWAFCLIATAIGRRTLRCLDEAGNLISLACVEDFGGRR